MLVLKNIVKHYETGNMSHNALDGVSLSFRKNEFVSILGPSGSGKTTLLNIIGGLDKYTEGDLIINGKSTKKFKDADWDSYRNHSIGFVFQSYNLIPHQSVLANVELALTLSGVSRRERRRRASEVLDRVGLSNQKNKKPNQMSGGQMQRVAIARALVNNPDILLADEPTGALDSVTSVQIMELLKEVSKDRLVIMVTHNPELAENYSSRIVKVRDGKIVDDTNPYVEEKEEGGLTKIKKTSMSLFTALSLSLNNLMTKKARTFLTSFAGSIGIIGIALILSLSSGIKTYINQVQEDALSSYPIEIDAEQLDMSSLITGLMGAKSSSSEHDRDRVYASSVMYDLTNTMNNAETKQNNLKGLKDYFESGESGIGEYARAIQYSYSVPMNIYAKNDNGEYQKSDIMEVFNAMSDGLASSSSMSSLYSSFMNYSTWSEILTADDGASVSDVITDQYELVAGDWPATKNDILLVMDKNNEITDITLYSLGLKSTDTIISSMIAARDGEDVSQETESFSYEDILARTFKLILSTDYYTDSDSDGIWESIEDNEASMDVIISNGLDLKICGIIRPTDDSNTSSSSSATLYYTRALTEYVIENTNKADIVKAQQSAENENVDIFTGLPFTVDEDAEKDEATLAQEVRDYFASLSTAEKSEMYKTVLSIPDAAETERVVSEYMANYPDRASLEEMIYSQYSGVSGITEDSIKSFIENYSDDELREMVEEEIRSTLKAQAEKSAEETINGIVSAPTDDELKLYKDRIYAQMPDKNTQMLYLVSEYVKSTGMPQATVYQFVMTLSEDEVASRVDELVTATATELFAQYNQTSDEVGNEKIAAEFDKYYPTLTDTRLAEIYDTVMPPKSSESTLKDNLKLLGVADSESPSAIFIYASTFADKDKIADIITDYNNNASEEDKITYTDYVAIIMSSVTTIIDAISYVLIAFVSISLVVSSIMIGIITYISVLERTKEIGILRAIGASKKDVSRVFNAETLIVGFISGALGIIVTIVLCLPINTIIRALSGIQSLTAYLPVYGGISLLVISMLLTFIAGLFPSKIAAKKDPVEALRSE